MALLRCPDCEGKVSDLAPACPHCGRPAPFDAPSGGDDADHAVSTPTPQPAPDPDGLSTQLEMPDESTDQIAATLPNYTPWKESEGEPRSDINLASGCATLFAGVMLLLLAIATKSITVLAAYAVVAVFFAIWGVRLAVKGHQVSAGIAAAALSIMLGLTAIVTIPGILEQRKEEAETEAARQEEEEAKKIAAEERLARLTTEKSANLQKGKQLLEERDYAEGLTFLRLVTEVEPDNIEVNDLIANAIEAQEEEKTAAREKELLALAKPLPSSESAKLLEIYRELHELRPEHAVYDQRFQKYSLAEHKRKQEQASRERRQRILAEAELLLLDWRWYTEHGYAQAVGRVKNSSGRRLENIQVVVEWKTGSGALVKTGTALLEYNPIMPGQTSPFKVMAKNNPEMTRATISFKTLFGGTVKWANQE